MAIDFTDTSSEWLSSATTPVSSMPFSFACWFATPVDANGQICLMSISDSSSNGDQYLVTVSGALGDGDTGRYLMCKGRDSDWNQDGSAVSDVAVSGTGWHHCTAVWTSATSRTIYLDGVFGETETVSEIPGGTQNRFALGRLDDLSPNWYWDGRSKTSWYSQSRVPHGTKPCGPKTRQ